MDHQNQKITYIFVGGNDFVVKGIQQCIILQLTVPKLQKKLLGTAFFFGF